MSFFDQASLVMIPSGYKTSKVYSVKPTDGSGDLAFTRSNDTASRVNSAGLIEKVRTNLITYSQDFGNAAWAVDQLTKTTGQVDPNGGTTAVLLTSTNTFSTYMYQVKAGLGCLSIYAKAGTRSTFALIPTGYNNGAFFDLSSVTATASGIGSLAKIESVGGGWFRCSVATSSSTDFIVSLSNIAGTGSVIGDTMTFAFAQGETGDIATDYIATTSAAVSVGPVANVPRLDYLNSSCPRLLLEGQRTSLVLFSEQLNNAAWVKSNASVTANQTTSPSGYVDADKLVENSSSSFHDTNQQSISYTAAAHTISVFAKAAGRNHIFLQIFDGVTFYTSGTFNLSNGTVSGSGSIVFYGNGWYRCSFTATTANGGGGAYINLSNGTTGNYAGDGTSGVFLYGAQVEAGAYATSYIPTLGAAVTRGADAASKTGISSLIGQTEGTIFIDFVQKASTSSVVQIQLNDGSNANRVQIENGSNGTGVLYVFSGGSLTAQIILGTFTSGTRYKIAATYKLNDFAVYVNGVLAGTDTSGAVPVSMSRIDLGAEVGTPYTGYELNQALLFKTRLSNADLAALTA